MNDIANITGTCHPAARAVAAPTATDLHAPTRAAQTADLVEISDIGSLLAEELQRSHPRLARIAQIRGQIQSGAYETDEKLQRTVDRVYDELTRR